MNKSEKVFCMCEFGDLLCRWKGSFLEFENLLFVDNNEVIKSYNKFEKY
jgi:hypothetical protein